MSALPAITALGRRGESLLAGAVLLAMGILPVVEMALRGITGSGIPGAQSFVQHLTLWVAFLGAMLATREGRHLSLSTGLKIFPDRIQHYGDLLAAAASTAVSAGLFWASWKFVKSEYDFSMGAGGHWLPVWAMEAILPLAFLVITLRLIFQPTDRAVRLAAFAGAALTVILIGIGMAIDDGFVGYMVFPGWLVWAGVVALFAAAVMGAPIFVVIGGAALLLFLGEDVPVAAVPVETIRIVTSSAIPAIPLFTLTGYLLAETGAGERLVRLFRALVGWLPGGLPIAVTLVCAFFTTFTGASGATILALGGLLLPVLVLNRYPERFSLGLLTATGSIGLLFPPSLAVILYAVIAQVPIPDMFVAGIVPGAIMVGAVCLYGVWIGRSKQTPRTPFDPAEALAAINEGKWEILLPVIVLVGLFGGYATLVESAAITVVYTLVVGLVIHRDLDFAKGLPDGVRKCVTLIGGVFTILGVAMGLTNYMVDAEIPMRAADWVEANVGSKLVFLLALNVFLLAVGCLMDIFSAIAVVVPLILPIAAVFGVDPLHLGVIFLANLELGYLTPPVGINLFLSAYRFEKPVIEVWRAVLPFLLILAMVVLLVTYVPWIIIGV
ncbi:MAG: TRAP transporter large permease subunit [Alphaproteobacteria bacterium]|nr:TRAP transporter large permease subunit [Alphaproteobacteria bacterium]